MMWKAASLAALFIGTGMFASAQVAPVGRRSMPVEPSGQVVRQIDDPSTGQRWLLMRDPSHPGGPGRLTPITKFLEVFKSSAPVTVPRMQPKPVALQPVIRSGDRLIVEDSSSRIDARFDAVALGSAAAGGPLRVRLVLGGKVVRAIALGPGRAAFAPAMEVQP